jgi:hypothetical protein
MCMFSPVALNQVALVIGFFGAVLLAFSNKIGLISKDGSVIFTGLDPMDPAEDNVKRVKSSHWRNRYLTPVGWGMLAVSFLMQLVASWL